MRSGGVRIVCEDGARQEAGEFCRPVRVFAVEVVRIELVLPLVKVDVNCFGGFCSSTWCICSNNGMRSAVCRRDVRVRKAPRMAWW